MRERLAIPGSLFSERFGPSVHLESGAGAEEVAAEVKRRLLSGQLAI